MRFLSSQKEVEAYSAIVMTQAMASHQGRIKGAMLRGIDWKQEKQATAYKNLSFQARMN